MNDALEPRDEAPAAAGEPLRDDELVPEDDAIIGRALRRSLLVVLGLAVLAVALLAIVRRPRDPAPEHAIETSAPLKVAPPPELAPPPVTFTDVTRQAGIDFVHENGARGLKLLPESMGSGAAFFDYDGDLDPDLLLINGTTWPGDPRPSPPPTSRLYRNDGGGRFTDVSRASGLDLELYGTGVAVGDVDGDGRRDVFVAALGTNRLLLNRGGRFVDVTERAGVGGAPDAWSTSCGFFDMDRDGDLDLFVVNYVRWSKDIDLEVDYRLTGVGRAYGPPVNYQGTFSYLYRNDGAGSDGTVRFTDVSAASGIQVTNPATGVPVGKGLGLLTLDVDGDGWTDVLVANDTVRNFLFRNLGPGADGDVRFEEVGELWGLAYGRNGEATGAMGIDGGFLRNDADLGFAIGNFANEMTSLYLAQGDPTLYADEAIPTGVGAPSRTLLTFGVLAFDYDLDARLDLLATNGHLETEIQAVDPSQSYEQPAQLFWNAGPDARQTFIEVPPEQLGALATPLVGRGSACADVDVDGDLDVVLTQAGRPALLVRNDQDLGHHWLRLRLVGRGMNRDAIGAWVELRAGGTVQRRPVTPTRSYQSQSELTLTFGLGGAARIDGLRITWPDGTVQELPPPAPDRLLVVEQGDAG